MKLADIDTFTRHYLIAALWYTRDDDYGDDDVCLDANYSLDDCSPELLADAFGDCTAFQMLHAADLAVAYEMYTESGKAAHPDAGSPEACAGHDFWLTRQGHGVGFWDRGFGPLGDTLTAACKEFPEVNLYTREGLVYGE